MPKASLTHSAMPAGIAYQTAAVQNHPPQWLVDRVRAIGSAESPAANSISPLPNQDTGARRHRWINRYIYPRLRTKHPKDCFRLAMENGLNAEEYRMLEMKAIMGPAAQRLRRGESCDILSRVYGGIGGLSFAAREGWK